MFNQMTQEASLETLEALVELRDSIDDLLTVMNTANPHRLQDKANPMYSEFWETYSQYQDAMNEITARYSQRRRAH
jgi:hypothetical protein